MKLTDLETGLQACVGGATFCRFWPRFGFMMEDRGGPVGAGAGAGAEIEAVKDRALYRPAV